MKKKLGRVLATLMASALMLGSLASCGGGKTPETTVDPAVETTTTAADEETSADDQTNNEAKSDEVLKIGVIQFIEHGSLNQAYDGFVKRLNDRGYVEGENLKIDLQNGQGEQANCQTIAGQFAVSDYDLILAIATPAAQAAANVIKDKPILVTAVTDLETAQLVDSNDAPGGNVSGTSDMTPIKDQIELITELFPETKTIGTVYSSSEANSELQIKMAKETCDELGLELLESTISSTNEIQQVTESIIHDVDAIYLASDNLIASAMPTIAKVAMDNDIPIIPAVEAMCADGGLASVSINYFNLGEQTADMALRVFEDGEDVSTMPVEFITNPELVFNQDYADQIGYTFPEEFLGKAREAVNPEE